MSKKGMPTKPNKTDKATASDTVFTKNTTAKWIVDYFNPKGSILEPAAGENAFYNLFDNEEKYRCEITDGLDFFEWDKKVDWIITNPPYNLALEFAQTSLIVAKKKVALLMKINFLEGVKRKSFLENSPLKYVYVFSKRQTLTRPDWEGKNKGFITYAWFVWEIGYEGETIIKWL
jgi:hypothetical protein